MKKFFIWTIIICSIFIFAYAFSASYNSQNIDRLDYVIAIGIDKAPNDNNLLVSFEFTDLGAFSESDSGGGSTPIIDTVVAPSISEAINLIDAYAGKQINLSHCKVVIFSEDVAKQGILEEVTYLMNEPQIRPTTNIVIANENAYDYIENSTSSLEGILTKYYDIFPTSAEYTGYTSNILLSRFYQNLTSDEAGAVAILGIKSKSNKSSSSKSEDSQSSNTQDSSIQSNTNSNKSSNNSSSINSSLYETNAIYEKDSSLESISPDEKIIGGDRGTENMGLAVFNQDRYIGTLSAIETLCYTLIEEEVDNFSIRIDSPFDEGKKIDLSVSSLEPAQTKIDISGNAPVLTIILNLTAKALTGQDTLNFSDKDTLNTINTSLNDYLSSKMKDYLYKTSREYKCDINGFYRTVKQKFLTIPEYENYDWKQKYQSAEFNVNIDSNVISGFLVQNS